MWHDDASFILGFAPIIRETDPGALSGVCSS
jgi:hypothetical protein